MKSLVLLSCVAMFLLSGCAQQSASITTPSTDEEKKLSDADTKKIIDKEGLKFRSKIEKEIKFIKDTVSRDSMNSHVDLSKDDEPSNLYSPMWMMLNKGEK